MGKKKRYDQASPNSLSGTLDNNISRNLKWPLLILAASTFIAYVFSFGNDFVYFDDQIYITENNLILHPTSQNIQKLLTQIVSNNYHPLTMLSLALNVKLFGSGFFSFIFTNVFFHVLNTLLVFEFIRRLTKGEVTIAFFTALVFGIHPMHVESVSWISERKDVLYALFFLLSAISYINFKDSGKYKWVFLSFLFFILSCLSKAMAVSLPLVLVLIDYWYGEKLLSLKNLIIKTPFFLIALLTGLISMNVQSGKDFYGLFNNPDKINAVSSTLTPFTKFCYGTYGFVRYHVMAIFPQGQSPLHSYSGIPIPPSFVYIITIILFLAYLALFVWSYKKNKYLFFGMGFFTATIILVLQFISVGRAFMAERYSYLPYVGLFFIIFYLLNKFLKKNTFRYIVFPFVFLFFLLTVNRQKVWANSLDLWNDVYSQYPDDNAIFEGFAGYFGSKEMYEEAREFANKALEKKIESYFTYVVLANISALDSLKTGNNIEPSLILYKKALSMKSTDRKVYLNRAITYSKAGRHADAVTDFSIVLNMSSLKEDSLTVLQYRSYANLMSRNYPESLSDYNYVIGQTPDTSNTKNYNDRAIVKYNLGDLKGAISDLEKAVQLDPAYIEARNNLEKLRALGN